MDTTPRPTQDKPEGTTLPNGLPESAGLATDNGRPYNGQTVDATPSLPDDAESTAQRGPDKTRGPDNPLPSTIRGKFDGGLGGLSATASAKMLDRATREGWDLPPGEKAAIARDMARLARDSSRPDRARILAARVLVSMDAADLAARRLEQQSERSPSQHVHVHLPSLQADAESLRKQLGLDDSTPPEQK